MSNSSKETQNPPRISQIEIKKIKEKGQMDLNIIANNLNDDCLSYIYSFVNTRQICFEVLKQKHDTILTNYILRPTIKRFTKGKYYSEPNFLGNRVFRVEKITNCFITIHYMIYGFVEETQWDVITMKRRYDKDDYEYFKGKIDYNTKDVIELDNFPTFGKILWNEFNWIRERFCPYNKYTSLMKADKMMFDIKETKGDFDWLMIDLRKKYIVKYETKVVEALTKNDDFGVGFYQTQARKLNDLNTYQLLLQSETK